MKITITFFCNVNSHHELTEGETRSIFSHFAGAEAEAEGGEAAGAQPAGEAEERAGGPQEDTRTQTGGLSHPSKASLFSWVTFSIAESSTLTNNKHKYLECYG